MRKLKKLFGSRLFIYGMLVLFQLAVIFFAVIGLRQYFVLYSFVSLLLGAFFVVKIINHDQNMAYKLAWCIVILVSPIFGVLLYLIFNGNRISRHESKNLEKINSLIAEHTGDGEDVINALENEDREAARQAKYIRNSAFCPPCFNSGTKYFSSGEEMFEPFLAELRKAEKYIFIEYFIIGEGKMWDEIHGILLDKIKNGVDVRVIYDDVGCMFSVSKDFAERLNNEGIKCRAFNKISPVLSGRSNNRDHRKICSVDGCVAFTGGVNLSDEYINTQKRFGYWKDSAVMVEGRAAWSLTVLFLSMWEYLDKVQEEKRGDYSGYKPVFPDTNNAKGYIQPYTDDPHDQEDVGENVYLGMISSACDYIYIMTPYLIIDEKIEEALCLAAKSGLDVRIITPGIPDKKLVKMMTESYYPKLIRSGVKIYEFKPGFIHAKTFLCDGKIATVGSINLDYRSLYLHFECGTWMYGTECIENIYDDFTKTFDKSSLVSGSDKGLFHRFICGLLRVIAPLL